LGHVFPVVHRFTEGGLKDDLTDSGVRFKYERKRRHVTDFQDLPIVYSGLNETRGHVHQETNTGKPGSALNPPAQVGSEPDSFLCYSEDSLTGQESERTLTVDELVIF
jgi:hypothetical protein